MGRRSREGTRQCAFSEALTIHRLPAHAHSRIRAHLPRVAETFHLSQRLVNDPVNNILMTGRRGTPFTKNLTAFLKTTALAFFPLDFSFVRINHNDDGEGRIFIKEMYLLLIYQKIQVLNPFQSFLIYARLQEIKSPGIPLG